MRFRYAQLDFRKNKIANIQKKEFFWFCFYVYQKKQLVLKISELETKFKTFLNSPSYRYFCKVWRNIGEVVQKMVVFLVPMVHSQLYLTQGKPICIFFFSNEAQNKQHWTTKYLMESKYLQKHYNKKDGWRPYYCTNDNLIRNKIK